VVYSCKKLLHRKKVSAKVGISCKKALRCQSAKLTGQNAKLPQKGESSLVAVSSVFVASPVLAPVPLVEVEVRVPQGSPLLLEGTASSGGSASFTTRWQRRARSQLSAGPLTL
jgi:hypothetical protein